MAFWKNFVSFLLENLNFAITISEEDRKNLNEEDI